MRFRSKILYSKLRIPKLPVRNRWQSYSSKKQFHSVRNTTRSDARQVKRKSHRLNVNLVTVYNPMIKNLETVIRSNLPILYSDPEMKNIFPEGSINITYKRGKSLREFISPS